MTFEEWWASQVVDSTNWMPSVSSMKWAWEAATKAERDACAKLAEDRHEVWNAGDGLHDGDGLPAVNCDVTACANIAAAIRARGAE